MTGNVVRLAQSGAAIRRRTPGRVRTGALPTESQEQAVLCAWCDYRGLGYFSVPNGARVRPSQARRLRREGMRAGAPDLVLHARTPGGSPIAIELKRARGGRLSPEQEATHAAMRLCGWVVIVAYGAEDAIRQLLALGVGRGRVLPGVWEQGKEPPRARTRVGRSAGRAGRGAQQNNEVDRPTLP